jgi:hypothetical protein
MAEYDQCELRAEHSAYVAGHKMNEEVKIPIQMSVSTPDLRAYAVTFHHLVLDCILVTSQSNVVKLSTAVDL